MVVVISEVAGVFEDKEILADVDAEDADVEVEEVETLECVESLVLLSFTEW